jgi:hypothetical protein
MGFEGGGREGGGEGGWGIGKIERWRGGEHVYSEGSYTCDRFDDMDES